MYLTADSPNVLEKIDPNCAYIIGGIVDRNRHPNLTFNKAKEQKIGHDRLPIAEHVKLNSSCVLTVNQVFDIMATFINTEDWAQTFKATIRDRKIDSEEYR